MICLTGASGFLGKAVLRRLSENGIKVRALYRKMPPPFFETPEWMKADLTDDYLTASILDGCAGIIHCAGIIKGDKELVRKVNLEGTKRLLKLAREKGIAKFIFVSSIDALLLDSAYAQSKREAEWAVMDSGLRWDIIRPAVMFGGGDERNFAQLERLIRKSPVIPLPFSGRFRWEPVCVDDVAEVLVRKACDVCSSGSVVSVVGPEMLSFRQIISIMEGHCKLRRLNIPLSGSLTSLLARLTTVVAGGDRSREVFGSFVDKIACAKEGEMKERLATKLSSVFSKKA
jgi:uncharacterized protein YbjT (DUF2867 family)